MALSDAQYEFLVIQQWVMGFGMDIFLTGMYSCMILFILYYFASSRRCRAQTSSKILTAVILLMFAIRIMHVGTIWYQIWFSLVKNGDSRDSVFSAIDAAPNFVLSDVTGVLLTAIADSVMVWRCWIMSSSSVRVTLLPFLLNFLAIVFGLVYVSFDHPGSDTPPIAILMSTLNMAFSVATTILSTLIITIRILMVGKVPGDVSVQKRYSKPLAIIIESSLLYTIAFIIYIPFFAITSDFTDTTYFYVDSIAQNMTVIAPALIMLRVLMSKAHPSGEHSKSQSPSKITTLRFDHDDGSRSDHSHDNSPISSSHENGDEGVEIWQSCQTEKETV